MYFPYVDKGVLKKLLMVMYFHFFQIQVRVCIHLPFLILKAPIRRN